MSDASGSITIAIVEARQLQADALALLLELDDRIRVVSVATFDGVAPSARADCVLVAVDDARGIGLAGRLAQDEVRVIGLHSGLGPELAAQLFDASVAAAVRRDVGAQPVIDVLVAEVSFSTLVEPGKTPRVVLSDRELAVLRLIAEGRTAAEIARKLHVSTGETAAAKRRLLRKLGVRTQTEAVASGRRLGILGSR